MDVQLYISPSLTISPLAQMPSSSRILNEKKYVLGNWSDTRIIETSFKVPKEVQHNGTLWGHFFVAHSGMPLDPTVSGYDPTKAFFFSRPMTQYLAKKKVIKKKNLLASGEEEEVEEEVVPTSGPIVASYYHPNFTLSVIPDPGLQPYYQLPPATREFFQLDRTGARDKSGQNAWYYPVLYLVCRCFH
jgi:hypothetical protein